MPKKETLPVSKARILIVDDEEIFVHSLKINLLHQGYSVICASNGREALSLMGKEPVDLVISDLVMPDIDGIQLINESKERYPALPFIVFTAQGSIESAVAAIKAGALDYLENHSIPKHSTWYCIVPWSSSAFQARTR